MSGWIDVNDRLPDLQVHGLSKFVLVTSESKYLERKYVETACYTIDGWYDLVEDEINVLAWMPLPDPYVKEGTT